MLRILAADADALDALPPAIARKMTDRYFEQNESLMISAAFFVFLGSVGFLASGHAVYLIGSAMAAAIGAWRWRDAAVYGRLKDTAPPSAWARRGQWSSLAVAASWGAWAPVVLIETRAPIVAMVVGAQSACVIGAQVRNCTLPRMSIAQALLSAVPLVLACWATCDILYIVYTLFVGLHVMAAVRLCRFLHRQTLAVLMQDHEKAALVGQLESANQELEVMNQHLEAMTVTDALTGVANRRAFDLASAREWRRSARERTPLSMLLIDIDHFKLYNDFYGHPGGDDCLREVAGVLRAVLSRPCDMVARYGGEEFVILLPATPLESAALLAERAVELLGEQGLAHEASAFGVVTVSIGVACLFGDPAEPVQNLTARADAALYAAKRGGRNRVHVAAGPVQALASEPVG